MKPRDVVDLYRRRGSVILWQRARTDADTIDPTTQTPAYSAGGRRIKAGAFGEEFGFGYPIIGYLQAKISSTFSEVYGLVDDRAMQLTVPTLHVPDIERGLRPLPTDLQAVLREGRFVTHEKGATVTRDRFIHNGIRWIVKSAAVPIIDGNETLAWRMLVAADTL